MKYWRNYTGLLQAAGNVLLSSGDSTVLEKDGSFVVMMLPDAIEAFVLESGQETAEAIADKEKLGPFAKLRASAAICTCLAHDIAT